MRMLSTIRCRHKEADRLAACRRGRLVATTTAQPAELLGQERGSFRGHCAQRIYSTSQEKSVWSSVREFPSGYLHDLSRRLSDKVQNEPLFTRIMVQHRFPKHYSR